ncbi:uncharacterized protein LOC123700959 [Colias croceus]|uniref:uncharacterized protein LOC123700959 n=1 Tax=Colias crocea TaxID=72248 RepID=UPI001E27EA01|nr:uncharacterized protein LOC123700959 [Colias croceus]XP_045504302.1 uncharacterized protein LOC123700959 [Colias croceus]
MWKLFVIATVLGVTQARPGLFFAAPLHAGIEYANTAPVSSHPAVELNAASEALLPPNLLKSNAFYSNPSIAAGLAKESWFTNKEMQVVEREAEKIPRQRIYDIVKNAGFLDQQ